MALTATAACDTFDVIMKQLSLKDPVLITISSDTANIKKLSIKLLQSLGECASEISKGLRIQKKIIPKP